MKVTRYFHIRTPIIYSFMKEGLRPYIVPDRADRNGGATVRVTKDTDKPELVSVQVAWCNKSDNYCRKTGRSIANKADPVFVSLRDLPAELKDIEEQALAQFSSFLRKNEDVRVQLLRNWDFAIRYFLPR